ncbi:MAG: c-type cytochrome [Nitrospirota bacterium]|nr:c-type cytochrome [Nitrospirota bacterium]
MKRVATGNMARMLLNGVLIGLAASLFLYGCAGDEKSAKGKKLYHHYCSHCHGDSGQQGEGFNWDRMPDPRPKNLASNAEMSTFSDKEIFDTIYRDMRDTSDPNVLDDDSYFAVSTMPTFKYTLSEEEIWSIVAHVRTLHGMSLTYDWMGRKKELEEAFQVIQQEMESTKSAYETAIEKAEAAQSAYEDTLTDAQLETYEPKDITVPEEAPFLSINAKFEEAKASVENFSKRPKKTRIERPDLTISDAELAVQVEKGKSLYRNTYGCNGCHSLNDEGGLVGPELDRAGFRLNPTWVYQWIRNPQAMKKHTRMPNLGASDADAKALTYYLGTLRAPISQVPVPEAE